MVAHIAAAPYINPTTNVNHEVALRTSPMSTWYGKVLELIEIRRGLRPCSPDDPDDMIMSSLTPVTACWEFRWRR